MYLVDDSFKSTLSSFLETLREIWNQILHGKGTYRVFKLDMHEKKHLLGYQKCTFES